MSMKEVSQKSSNNKRLNMTNICKQNPIFYCISDIRHIPGAAVVLGTDWQAHSPQRTVAKIRIDRRDVHGATLFAIM